MRGKYVGESLKLMLWWQCRFGDKRYTLGVALFDWNHFIFPRNRGLKNFSPVETSRDKNVEFFTSMLRDLSELPCSDLSVCGWILSRETPHRANNNPAALGPSVYVPFFLSGSNYVVS